MYALSSFTFTSLKLATLTVIILNMYEVLVIRSEKTTLKNGGKKKRNFFRSSLSTGRKKMKAV